MYWGSIAFDAEAAPYPAFFFQTTEMAPRKWLKDPQKYNFPEGLVDTTAAFFFKWECVFNFWTCAQQTLKPAVYDQSSTVGSVLKDD